MRAKESGRWGGERKQASEMATVTMIESKAARKETESASAARIEALASASAGTASGEGVTCSEDGVTGVGVGTGASGATVTMQTAGLPASNATSGLYRPRPAPPRVADGGPAPRRQGSPGEARGHGVECHCAWSAASDDGMSAG